MNTHSTVSTGVSQSLIVYLLVIFSFDQTTRREHSIVNNDSEKQTMIKEVKLQEGTIGI